jgi:HSP20 family protein
MTMQSELQNDDTSAEDDVQRLTELPTAAAPTDIYENEDEILIVADFPTVGPTSMDVRLEKGQLDLEGRQVPPKEQAGQLPPLLFARSFRVPSTVDPEGVSAELKNGVLRVTLKKSEESKPRRIKVTSA